MTKTMQILTCALALFAMPAAGFTQPHGAVAAARDAAPAAAADDAIELGDVGPTISAKRLLVATDVSEREPVGAADAFSIADTTHLYVFVEIGNPDAVETEVIVSWVDGATGEAGRPYVLRIGPHARFRTWARAAAPRKPGSFAVVLSDDGGNEIARTDFAMTE
jgi:hypothetical protein